MLKLLRMDAQDFRLHFKVQIVSGCRYIVEVALSKSVLSLQKTKH